MSIAIDASTPAGANSTVSSSFSPPANSLIIVALGSSLNVSNTSLTDNLGVHLTYTKINGVSDGFNDTHCELWWAFTSSSQTGMTITPSGGSQAIMPIVLTGASSTQNGPQNTNSSGSGTPTVTVTRNANSQTGSLMVAVAATRSTTPSFPAGQTDVFSAQTLAVNQGGDFVWAQQISALTADATTAQTLNVTAPTGTPYSMCAAEILPGAGGGGTVIPNLSRTVSQAVNRSLVY